MRAVGADGTRQWRVRGAGADLAAGARADAIWVELRREVFVRPEMALSARKRIVLDVRTERHRAQLVRVDPPAGWGGQNVRPVQGEAHTCE